MNCKSIRAELIKGLAPDETPLTVEFVMHLRECAGCRAFYESETRLYRSMDAGLRCMVNEAMPPSLLPTLRARVVAADSGRSSNLDWRVAALVVTTAAILLVIPFFVRHVQRAVSPDASLATKRQDASEGQRGKPVSIAVPDVSRLQVRGGIVPSVQAHSRHQPPPSVQAEVLVDHKEAQDLALFAQAVYLKPELGKALLNPVAPPPEKMLALQAIEIADLKVPRLETESW
jgi:hypothetical protein